mgnify:CR=1 FL=1
MKMFFRALFFLLFLPPVAVALEKGQLQAVLDGDTIVVEGQTVRLLGINTPEESRDNHPAEPGAAEATRTLKGIIAAGGSKNPTVRLAYDGNKTDRYDRLLAHVYLPDGTWLNRALLKAGVAHVYSFPDNRAHLRELLTAEADAREAGRGMWQHPDWQVLDSENLKPDARIGQFRLVRGTPLKAARVGERIYLNYGPDWRTDFTVEIPLEFIDLFEESGIDPLQDYPSHQLLVRGRLKPVNGVLVTVTHPEQIQMPDK